MIVWQVNWHPNDMNHKRFILANDSYAAGRSKYSNYVVSWQSAIARRGGGAYYFYLEFIK